MKEPNCGHAMRSFWRFIFLALTLTSAHARAETPVNGLYVLSESGRAVVALDGKEIHLGEKLNVHISRAWVGSVSNDNEKYVVSLNKEGPFSKDNSVIALCVEGDCVAFKGYGIANNKGYSAGQDFKSKSAAEAFAKHFSVAVQKRAHPGYALGTRFLPGKDAYSTNEPMPVVMEICNVGDEPFRFQHGGSQRGSRDNQYGFTAYGSEGAVPDTGSAFNMGGLFDKRLLKSGECFRDNVDLRKWFTFKQAGTYEITGTYHLEFYKPNNDVRDHFVIWEDYAAAKFDVIVK